MFGWVITKRDILESDFLGKGGELDWLKRAFAVTFLCQKFLDPAERANSIHKNEIGAGGFGRPVGNLSEQGEATDKSTHGQTSLNGKDGSCDHQHG